MTLLQKKKKSINVDHLTTPLALVISSDSYQLFEHLRTLTIKGK